MSTPIVDDFLQPLLELFDKPRGSLPAIAEALAEDCPAATSYQLRAAVKSLRQTWKYKSFPTHAACISAIRAAPASEFVPSATRPDTSCRPRGPAPILVTAERYVDEYDAASPARRVEMDRMHPGRYEGARTVIRSYASADDDRAA